MNPVRRLFRKGSVYTLGTAVQLSAAAVVLPIVTRLLDSAQYGVVALTLSINVVVTTLLGLGIPAAITREFFTEGGRDRDRARALIGSVGLVAALGAALLLATAPLWGELLVGADVAALMIGVMIAVPAAIGGAGASLLLVEERPLAYVAVVLMGSLGAQTLGILAIIVASPEATSYLAGYLLAAVMAALLGLLLSGSIRVRPASRALLRRALSIGLPTVPHSLAIFVLALGDRVVIQVVSGSSAVGRYQVAYALGSLGVALLSALQNAWVPITFSASDEERWEALAKMTAIVVRLGILAAVGITVVAPIALDVLAPASYDPNDLVTVAALVAAGAVPWAFYLPMSQVLFWQRRTRPLAWITPLSAIFNLALVALLVPPLGLAGAGLSTLLALMLQAFLCSRAAAASATVPWGFRRLVVPLIAGTVAIITFAALPSGPLVTALRVTAVAAIALTCLRLVRAEMELAQTRVLPR